MQFTETHTYDGSVEQLMAMLADSDAIISRYEGMGHRDVAILECVATDTTLRVKTSRVVDVDLPGFAKKVLKPTNTMVQVDEWKLEGATWIGAFDVEVKGAPAKVSGSMRLEPNGAQCNETITITVDVKVPLVGGKIADWIGKNDARKTVAEEFAAGDQWLKAQHG